MDKTVHSEPQVYDFRQYDRIWQRVAPGLEPYPRQEAGGGTASGTPAGAIVPAGTPTGSVTPAVPAMPVPVQQGGGVAASQLRQESQLPGASPDPCCMGSAAAEMLSVLMGFNETALEEQRQLQALVRQAPSWARQTLRDLAAENGAHARRLAAVYYLVTGACYRPAVPLGRIPPRRWCEALRERYHAAACGGFNYARAAEGTTDPCLTKLLEELSREAYAQAETLLELLERSLRA